MRHLEKKKGVNPNGLEELQATGGQFPSLGLINLQGLQNEVEAQGLALVLFRYQSEYHDAQPTKDQEDGKEATDRSQLPVLNVWK